MHLGVIMIASNKQDPRLPVVRNILNERGLSYHEFERWRGFGEKLVVAYESAKSMTQYTHIMLIDAYDVVVMASEEELLERFVGFGHPFVCQSEVNCWPDAEKADRYPACDTPWRFLNSGAYLAEREYLKDFFEKHGPLDPTVYDQRWFTDVYLKDTSAIRLDTQCVMFQSLLGSWQHLSVENKKLSNTLTGTKPIVAHHHGGADIRDENARRLWQ